MNLVRAISLGGGGRDLRGGNDSTQLICHVQLFIIALDCIFNIVVDNFLRDPLTVLIIFICQVFLLIIGLIFYLMASANQAMKEGMHEKVMRYHQLTTVLWTLYFSMLIWWYIWVLKRSWPSAGDHFSFTFSGSNEHDLSNQNSSRSTTTYSPQMTTTSTTTTTSSTEIPLTLSPTVNGEGELTTIFPSISFNQSNTNTTQSIGVTEKPGNNTISLFFPFRFFSIMNKTKGLVPLSPPISGHIIMEDFTFFWTPGFIAVYTIERSVSLFFYVAFILGTLHILNTSLIVEEDEPVQRAKHKMNVGTNKNTKQTVKQRIRSSLYGSSKNPIASPTNSHKSEFMDEDNGDSFIRHLEYDGDPFQNSQYEYQYKNNNYQPPITSFNYGSHYHPNSAAPYGDLNNEHPITSDGDEENASDKSSETEMNRKRRNEKKRESKNHQPDLKKNSKTLFSPSFTSQFKPSKNKDKQIEKTKGGLRNIMMMAELENATTGKNRESFSVPNDNVDFDRKSASIVSTSIDSIAASGSTDKLLMSNSSKNDNQMIYQSQNEAFHTE